MPDDSCTSIEVVKRVPFSGPGDTIESRLRRVTLKGFPDVRIYERARFELVRLSPAQIAAQLHTGQPTVYQTHLDRVAMLGGLFQRQGIDILDLDAAYDFVAVSAAGERTEWTMMPPVVESVHIPAKAGKLDYSRSIGERLSAFLSAQAAGVNPAASALEHSSLTGRFDLINDGSHRVHYGMLKDGVTVLRVSGMAPGFPYYAAPQPYSKVHVLARREDLKAETKTLVLSEPHHKSLYRLFPTGGIMTGAVRPDKHRAATSPGPS